MPVIGNPRTFHKKFKFIVEIDGVASAGFQKAGPLKTTVGEVNALLSNAAAGTLAPITELLMVPPAMSPSSAVIMLVLLAVLMVGAGVVYLGAVWAAGLNPRQFLRR